MPKKLLNKARVGVPRDEAAGGMAQGVKARGAQADGVASALEAVADGGRIEPPAEA